MDSYLAKWKIFFLIVIHVDIHLGQFQKKFEDSVPTFVGVLYKKGKKAFYSILLYEPILKLVKYFFCFVCL